MTRATRATSPANGENQQNRPKSRSIKPLARMIPFALRYKAMVAAALIALLMAAMATLSIPIAARRMIDFGFSSENTGFLDNYFLVFFLVALFLGTSSAARYYCVTWLGERIVTDIRDQAFRHIIYLSPSFYEVTRTGEILTRLTTDTTLIKTILGTSMSVALRNLVLLLGAGAMMVVTSAKLSALVLFALPVILLPLIVFGRKVRRLSRTAQDSLAHTSVYAGEALQAIKTVQANTHEARDQQAYTKAIETAFTDSKHRFSARALLTAFVITLAFSSVTAILWYGAEGVLASTMTGGELLQFMLYAVLAASSIGALSEIWGELQTAAGAAERLLELLAVTSEILTPNDPLTLPETITGTIKFNNVTFTYPTRPDQPSLKNFSLEIHPGETLALVGPSGAGKSTVFQLLLRFYNLQSGSITLEGVDIAKADPQDVRRQFSHVEQNPEIFSFSARENIRYGRSQASDQEVVAAAKTAQIHDFLTSLPDGYDTLFGERAVTLSGGERQRLAIARALLRNAPVLLLDEATSALDAQNEHAFQQALETLTQNRTTLVIAHRLATVQKADRIIVMQQGRIVETGSHDELIAQNGLYKRLARLQFTANDD